MVRASELKVRPIAPYRSRKIGANFLQRMSGFDLKQRQASSKLQPIVPIRIASESYRADTRFYRRSRRAIDMNHAAISWWRKGILYQIYPRSFQDSNGDGIGDLPGIIHRMPYLFDLGVDAVWLSPIFPSPMADFGYDISNYLDVDPIFGTLDDFDTLVAAAHASDLKVILDLVPNHTSDQHPWFIESRGSHDNPKRDWYLWHEPRADGTAPNNWMSEFGGSAWKYDAGTKQYYYHAFLREQPDLNWRNPAVRQAIYDVMRFWLRRGVDGFRVDVLWHLIKDAEFRDNPPNPNFRPGRPPHEALLPLYTTDRPEILDVVTEMRRVVDEFRDRVLIGEIYLPVDRLVAYYGRELSGAHLPFNFALLSAPWNARAIAKLIDDYESALPADAWPNWVLGNHDRPRVASRVGQPQARVAAMLLLTLRGTPYAVLWRRNRHATGRYCARSGTRSVREKRPGDRRRTRRLPHAHAMECRGSWWVHHRRALVTVVERLRPRECGESRHGHPFRPQSLSRDDRVAKGNA